MKLRYYKDPNIYFNIFGILHKNEEEPEIISNDSKYETLKSLVTNTSGNKEVIKKLREDNENILIATMAQNSDNRDSTKNNILYYCESAIFKFDTHLKLFEVIFIFRTNIDPLLSTATYYIKDHIMIYNDDSIIIMDYLNDECLDRELADFLLNDCKDITY